MDKVAVQCMECGRKFRTTSMGENITATKGGGK